MSSLVINKYTVALNLYIFLWWIYSFHLYATGFFPIIEQVSNVILGVNLLVSIFAFIHCLFKYPLPRFLKVLSVLIFLFVIYGLLNIVRGETIVVRHSGTVISPGSYMIGPLRSFLPIFVFFLFGEKGYLNEKAIRFWFYIFMVSAVFFFFTNLFKLQGGTEEDLLTNNIGYLFYALFPFVYFFKKGWFQYLVAMVIMMLSIMSIKRGAILVSSVCFLYFLYSKLKNSKGLQIGSVLFVISAFLVVGVHYVERLYNSSAIFQHRVEKTIAGDDSGRSRIRNNLLSIYSNESNLRELVVGRGGNATLRYGENYAHNDWLEILFDMGIVGLVIFIVLWFYFFQLWWKSPKGSELSGLWGMMFLSQFSKTFFSMWYSNLPIFTSLLLGYCLYKHSSLRATS